MSEERKTEEPELPALVKKAPELIPLWDWWVKEGKSTLVTLGVVALLVAGYYGGRSWYQSRYAAANQALSGAYTVEDLEAAASSYGSTKIGPAIKLRLAKSYYDAERYDDALAVYDELSGKKFADGAFDDIVVVGRAYCLEGQGKFAEARKVFSDYAADEGNKDAYLLLTAQLGAARTRALAGEKDAALKDLEALKAAKKDDTFAEARIDRLSDLIKRYDPNRKAPSLFDAANAAEKAIKAEAKPEAPKAEAKPAAKPEAPKPAAAKPEAPKTEAKPAAKPEAPKPAAAKPDAPKTEAKPAAK
jgi:predicted negative regulator of RcsB-dependent stress response